MRDFSLFAAQIRAARGLLGWSQAYLAEGCNIHRATLVDLESGKREPHEATLTVLMTELTAAGIVFTETGRGVSSLAGEGVCADRDQASKEGGYLTRRHAASLLRVLASVLLCTSRSEWPHTTPPLNEVSFMEMHDVSTGPIQKRI
ncbi:transcriptional regulator with XRE-family HTH domain [Bradyrhizobium sp. GM24.11]